MEKGNRETSISPIKKPIIFPNGRVGQEYNFEFIAKDYIASVEEISFDGLDAIGLQFCSETERIKGIPNTAGDHKIKIRYKLGDWERDKPEILEKEILLIINPDPRSLWNDIPTPKDIEYYKDDSAKAFVSVSSKDKDQKESSHKKGILAASQRGRSHAHEGKARDDDFSVHYDKKTGWYIMVVADGAGSAKFSRKGSEIACHTVLDVCRERLSVPNKFEEAIWAFQKNKSPENRKAVGDLLYNVMGGAAFKAYKNIEKESLEKGSPIKDYSTTLLVSICRKYRHWWFIGTFWVGDGGIGIYTKEPSYLKILGEPDGGEFAGQTRFLTMSEIIQSEEIYRRLRFDIVKDFTALILMSDGVTDPKFETDANLKNINKWNDLWNDLSQNVELSNPNEESANQLLKWLDFWSKGNHDDRTITILS
jgi:serine/threonine protein phosphatase PrpC